MKLATLQNGTRDGKLIVVSRDQMQAVDASSIATTMLDAVERWDEVSAELQDLYIRLSDGHVDSAFDFDPAACLAPLPRAPQWLDASAFLNHGNLMSEAWKTEPIPDFETIPVMYQGASDDFLASTGEVAFPDEAYGIDFEGEFGAIVGEIPPGATPQFCQGNIRLLVQINDWSLRRLGPREMKSGFGFIQAKPSSAFAPVAVTPDELGNAWQNGRVHLSLHVTWNGERFGEPHGSEMNFSFGELLAHAVISRRLSAGSIIGSGTVSNQSRSAGSACIAERQVIEKIDLGEIKTGFMQFGDEVRMEAKFDDGTPGPFGVIQQTAVQYRS